MQIEQADEIVLGPLDSAGRSFRIPAVRFTLRCTAVQAYVLLANAAGKPIALHEMTWDGDAWKLTLGLRPASYRYRYYVSNGRVTAYFSPADTDPIGRTTIMDGMDSVFDVAPSFGHLPQSSSHDRDKPVVRPISGYASLSQSSHGYVL